MWLLNYSDVNYCMSGFWAGKGGSSSGLTCGTRTCWTSTAGTQRARMCSLYTALMAPTPRIRWPSYETVRPGFYLQHTVLVHIRSLINFLSRMRERSVTFMYIIVDNDSADSNNWTENALFRTESNHALWRKWVWVWIAILILIFTTVPGSNRYGLQ